MKIQYRNDVVPPGNHRARFSRVANQETKFGSALVWEFVVLGGEYDGWTVTRMTGPKANGRTECGRILSELLGRALHDGDQLDTEEIAGHVYDIAVEAQHDGFTRVACVRPPGVLCPGPGKQHPPSLPGDSIPF